MIFRQSKRLLHTPGKGAVRSHGTVLDQDARIPGFYLDESHPEYMVAFLELKKLLERHSVLVKELKEVGAKIDYWKERFGR